MTRLLALSQHAFFRLNVQRIAAIILLICAMSPAVSLEAEPAVEEEFVYPTGPLVGQDGGTAGPGRGWLPKMSSDLRPYLLRRPDWLAVAGGAVPLREISSFVFRNMSLQIPTGTTYYVSFIAQVRSGESIVRLPLELPRCIFIGKGLFLSELADH